MSRFSPTDIKRYRRELARKGWEVNQKLTDLLAKKDARMSTIKLPNEQKPGLRPDEKMRMWLDQIMRAQKRLGTDEFGKCIECGEEFAKGALDDTPWLETCRSCMEDDELWF